MWKLWKQQILTSAQHQSAGQNIQHVSTQLLMCLPVAVVVVWSWISASVGRDPTPISQSSGFQNFRVNISIQENEETNRDESSW